MALGGGVVRAAVTYGNGYYTNLCGTGTAATGYNCNLGCNPETGSCTSDSQGVVKWVCLGKWNQCLESESQWGNQERVDGMGCGYTVQLSLFDKKCRREDGSWDATCRLLGYMAWYSGECWEGGVQITPRPSPTVRPSPTLAPTSTPTPTVTPAPQVQATGIPKPTVTVTPVPVVTMCGKSCRQAVDCQAGFACVGGQCRNPACPADKSCFCQGEVAATLAAIVEKTPDTGPETWVGMAGMAILVAVGVKMRRLARKVW